MPHIACHMRMNLSSLRIQPTSPELVVWIGWDCNPFGRSGFSPSSKPLNLGADSRKSMENMARSSSHGVYLCVEEGHWALLQQALPQQSLHLNIRLTPNWCCCSETPSPFAVVLHFGSWSTAHRRPWGFKLIGWGGGVVAGKNESYASPRVFLHLSTTSCYMLMHSHAHQNSIPTWCYRDNMRLPCTRILLNK